MTSKQLEKLEADLQKRGYKKWTTCLVGREDYDWFKSFGEHKDEDGDTTCDYQIAFRIFQWCRKYDNFYPPKGSEVWLTVTMIPTTFDNRLDCDYSLQIDVPDIDMCEDMMRKLFEAAKPFLKTR